MNRSGSIFYTPRKKWHLMIRWQNLNEWAIFTHSLNYLCETSLPLAPHRSLTLLFYLRKRFSQSAQDCNKFPQKTWKQIPLFISKNNSIKTLHNTKEKQTNSSFIVFPFYVRLIWVDLHYELLLLETVKLITFLTTWWAWKWKHLENCIFNMFMFNQRVHPIMSEHHKTR